jgi:hypothetical protein
MVINVAQVLARAEERKNAPKPLPTVIIRKEGIVIRKPDAVVRKIVAPLTTKVAADANPLLEDLEKEYTIIRKERAKLSSHTFALVNEIAAKIRKQSGPGVEKEFLDGNCPVPAIKEHYAKIAALTDQLTALYDKIRSVKETGALPKEKPLVETIDNLDTQDIKAINYEIRRLDDLIHKKKKNIEKSNGGIKKPKNSDRILIWKEVVAMAELKRDTLKKQLSRLRYESR